MLPPRTNPGSGISSGLVLSQREEGRSRGCCFLGLLAPGSSREAPNLGYKGFRCPGQRLAARKVQAGNMEGPSPLMVRPEGLELPPGLFT